MRWELFLFTEVRDVLATSDPDRVLVVHRGAAQPERWLQALRDSGFATVNVGTSDKHRFSVAPERRRRDPAVRSELRRRRLSRLHGRRSAPSHAADVDESRFRRVISDFIPAAPSRWSRAQRRATGAALALSGIGLALAVRDHAALLVLIALTSTSVTWVVTSLWHGSRRATRRSEPASAGLIASGEVPTLRFHDEEPRVLCLGWLRPSVYVSTGALFDLPSDQLHACLAHQRHHARRRDSLRLVVAQALSDGLPFLPVLSSLAAGYRRRIETLAALMTVASVASARLDLRQMPSCQVTGVPPLRDRVGVRSPASSVAWTVASIAACLVLVLHAAGAISLSNPNLRALGSQLCLVAAITTMVLGGATAVQRTPSGP